MYYRIWDNELNQYLYEWYNAQYTDIILQCLIDYLQLEEEVTIDYIIHNCNMMVEKQEHPFIYIIHNNYVVELPS